MKAKPAESIDEYIGEFPLETQKVLKQMRSIIRKAAPKAEETIKYGMPTFMLNGNLVHFSALKNHIGLYPVPREKEEFKKVLSNYKGSKSGAQFPLDQPLPTGLITKIVKDRVRTLSQKAEGHKKK